MVIAQAISQSGVLARAAVSELLATTLSGKFRGQKVLVLIPDHTRSLPLPELFRTIVEVLRDVRELNCLVALGTHRPLSNEHLNRLIGISADERLTTFRHVGLVNHTWDEPAALTSLGMLDQDDIKRIAGASWHPSLPTEINIRLNRAALEHDHILIIGPTFPHEVVGFSGGAKYLFPGISGPDVINAMHWLGALATVVGTIGIQDTPVRAMIHTAAQRLKTPVTLAALVVEGHDLCAVFVGDVFEAWRAAADLSSQRHIRRCAQSFKRVLSCAPAMYDELWTAGKAMYKLEPAVAPLGVLAHSTHMRGSGVMAHGGVEQPNVRVTLASKISPEDCAKLNLGYLDPATISLAEWQNREDEGILYVPKAGEVLYRRMAC